MGPGAATDAVDATVDVNQLPYLSGILLKKASSKYAFKRIGREYLILEISVSLFILTVSVVRLYEVDRTRRRDRLHSGWTGRLRADSQGLLSTRWSSG